jgi:hypothetical protein
MNVRSTKTEWTLRSDPTFVPSSVLINFSSENYFREYFKISQFLTMAISTRDNMKRNNRAANSSRPSFSTLGWVALLLSMSADASAFNAGVKKPLARELASSTDFNRKSNSATTGFTNLSRSRRLHQGLHSISTRLQYSEGNEDDVTAESSPSSTNEWWGDAFSSADAEIEEENQEGVDKYLEFLDRRYRRLHNTLPEEKKHTPFSSALNWLIQGSPNRNDVVFASKQQQQQQHALYALGVAGLASQKLLQKHHVAHQEQEPTSATAVQERPRPMIRDESSNQVGTNNSFSDSQIGSTIANKVILPVVRVIYMIEHRKQLFVRAQVQKLRVVLSLMVKSIAKSLSRGPIGTTKAVLEIGGGKKNIALTFTVAYTVFFLLRPMLQAVVSESSVGP